MGGLSSICAQKWIRQTRDVGTIAFSVLPACGLYFLNWYQLPNQRTSLMSYNYLIILK